MKVYIIWSESQKKIYKSNTHRSGIYTSLITCVAAYNNLRWSKKQDYKIKECELYIGNEVN